MSADKMVQFHPPSGASVGNVVLAHLKNSTDVVNSTSVEDAIRVAPDGRFWQGRYHRDT